MKNSKAKETERMRQERLAGTNNGMTTRTRTVPSKKHKNSSRSAQKREFNKILKEV